MLRYRPITTLRWIVNLLALVAAMPLCLPLRSQVRTVPVLRSIQQIRSLPRNEAQAGKPISLNGTVAVLSGWKNSFFLSDGHFGISVDRADTVPELHPGDIVHIDGVTNDGKFAPVALSHRIRITGHTSIPTVHRISSPLELLNGKKDSQLVAVRGTIESSSIAHMFGHDLLVFSMDIGRGTLVTVRVLHSTPETAKTLTGAVATVYGVCGSVFNTRRQFIGPRIFVNGPAEIHVERPAPHDPFDAAVTPIADLLRFDADSDESTRVKVQGVVTYLKPGLGFFLQSGAQAVFVQTGQQTPLALGTALQVAGYPQTGSYSPKLVNAVYRSAPPQPAITPLAVDASALITNTDSFTDAPYDGQLVRVRGTLLQEVPGTTENMLLLRGDTDVFSVRLPAASAHGGSALQIGSVLEVTGICTAIADEAHEARAVEMLLRSASDVTIVRGAPWWTAGNLLWVVFLLMLLVLALLAWIAFTRRESRLHELITMDQLTGLYNRRGFLLMAEEEWQRAKRRGQQMTVYFVDLDRFKEINDTYGHKLGDLALQTVSRLLQESFRKTDVIGRLGGDEFAIVALDSPEEIVRERLAQALQALNADSPHPFEIGWSIGALLCDGSFKHLPIEDLLSRADSLMYEQKRRHHLAFA